MPVCFNCGEWYEGVGLRESLNPNHGVCVRCARRYAAYDLAAEADNLLLRFIETMPKVLIQPVCRHCGAPVVYVSPDGAAPLWCTNCEMERRSYAR